MHGSVPRPIALPSPRARTMFWELHTAELQPTCHAEQFASLEDWLCEGSAVALVRRSLPRSFPKQSSGLVRHGITTVLRNDPSNSRDSLKSVFPFALVALLSATFPRCYPRYLRFSNGCQKVLHRPVETTSAFGVTFRRAVAPPSGSDPV